MKMREKFSKRQSALVIMLSLSECVNMERSPEEQTVRSSPLRATHHHELSNPYSVALKGNVQINKD